MMSASVTQFNMGIYTAQAAHERVLTLQATEAVAAPFGHSGGRSAGLPGSAEAWPLRRQSHAVPTRPGMAFGEMTNQTDRQIVFTSALGQPGP